MNIRRRVTRLAGCLAIALVVPAAPAEEEAAPRWTSACQTQGYFYAASRVPDPTALGGYAPSDNHAERVDDSVPQGQLLLLALPDEPQRFRGRHAGFRVVLANTTGDTVTLGAADSQLTILREALDAEGRWRPIEFIPDRWCGNSYHRLALPNMQQWSFTAPVYLGATPTKMRFALRLNQDEVLYSNEFDGFVNPEHFEPCLKESVFAKLPTTEP